MQKMIRGAVVAASVLALTVASPAMARQGLTSGGGSGGGGGGGSLSSGGVNSGGVKDGTDPAVVPCATLSNVSAPVGYYSTFAAIWNDYTVRSCATGTTTVNVTVTNTNVATGQVDYSATIPYTIGAGSNVGAVVDNDFAPFDTAYNVRIEARDNGGNLLDSSSLSATTPSPK